jgi:FPC/CPF motif-containing protein YcgG
MMETTSAPPALAPRLLMQREGTLFSAESGEPAPPWVQEHYRDFHEFVASESRPHPCGFGVAAEKRRKLRYSFVNREEISRPLDLARTLLAFQALAPTIGGRPALIVFVDVPTTLDAAEQEAAFWSLVQSLHDLDEAPWPDTIPTDLDDPLWQFCFAGEPWFINGHGTTYQKRLSRSSRRGLFLVLQTHANLDGIVGHTPAAEVVRRDIRQAVRGYDLVDLSPDFTIYGDPAGREWKQYWLTDDNAPRTGTCPLKIRVPAAVPDE